MNRDKPEPTTPALLASSARTRSRVATDIERLAAELTPAQLKNRALHAAEDSLESLAVRAGRGLVHASRQLASYVGKHPLVGVAVVAGAGVVVWRLAVARHR